MTGKRDEMINLKPCPFCGQELPIHYTVMQNRYVSLISCPDCNASVVSNKFLSDRDALAIWQTRPIEDALNKRIAELELIIDKLVEGIDSLTSEFPLEIEYVEAVEIAKDWKECEE